MKVNIFNTMFLENNRFYIEYLLKVKDKRDRRHTAVILISAFLCGRIPHVDELFSCESINQVHGSIIEFLGNLTPDLRSKFKLWLFDDMCHLKPHAEMQSRLIRIMLRSFLLDLLKLSTNSIFQFTKRVTSIVSKTAILTLN